jgi:hypothetical protein
VDLGQRAAREATPDERVHLADAGRERPPPGVLAAQRGRLGLEAAGPEQVLERALALGQGRGFGGERDGAHRFRFFFAINIVSDRSTVNPEDLVVVSAPTPIPRTSPCWRRQGSAASGRIEPKKGPSFLARR